MNIWEKKNKASNFSSDIPGNCSVTKKVMNPVSQEHRNQKRHQLSVFQQILVPNSTRRI